LFLLLGLCRPLFGREPAQIVISNSAYAYNGENGAWEQTRGTLTYFEDLLQPYLFVALNETLHFKAGAGLLLPFNQEQKIVEAYPYVQTKINFEHSSFEIGSLEGRHNFPPPILDPLVNLTPRIRVNNTTQVPINYETFPKGIFSHGLYEYGISYRWFEEVVEGEIYINWQLPDTTNHRERFDAGLINTYTWAGLPLYVGIHYWHNGGHENPHPIEVTENYTAAAGLRNKTFSVLYLASYYLPNRSGGAPNTFGQAVYGEYNLELGRQWVLTPSLFVSDELITKSHNYFSVEGDPFFRVPFYLGMNVHKTWPIFKGTDIKVGLVNGLFLPMATSPFSSLNVRYDQMIKVDFKYAFDV